MKYMLLLHRHNDGPPRLGTAEGEATLRAYSTALDAMGRAGVLVDCAPLAAASSTTTVRVRDGETILTDGPAAEIKEVLGGYAIVDCPDLDDAVRWAATIPAASDASVEIRPIVVVPSRV